jgi:hypothetical protein
MSVLKLPLLVDFQHKVSELVLPTTSCPSIIILENKIVCKNVVMVSLTTVMFLLFTLMHFWLRGILRWWFECAPTAYEVGHDCRKFGIHWYRMNLTTFLVLGINLFSKI